MKVATKELDPATYVDFYLDHVVVHQDGETYPMDYVEVRPNLIVAKGMSGEMRVEDGELLVSITQGGPWISTMVETYGSAPDLLRQLQPVIERYRPGRVKVVLSGLTVVLDAYEHQFRLSASMMRKNDWMTTLIASDDYGSKVEVTFYKHQEKPLIIGKVKERRQTDRGPARRVEWTTYYLDQEVESFVIEKPIQIGELGFHYEDGEIGLYMKEGNDED